MSHWMVVVAGTSTVAVGTTDVTFITVMPDGSIVGEIVGISMVELVFVSSAKTKVMRRHMKIRLRSIYSAIKKAQRHAPFCLQYHSD